MSTIELLGQIERQVWRLAIPPGIRLWDGRLVMPDRMPLRVMLTLRSPRVLTALVNPSMGKLARHYVEQDLDIDEDAREAIRMGEALSDKASQPQRRRFDIRNWFRHSRFYDRSAIRRHYDIGDALDVAQEQKNLITSAGNCGWLRESVFSTSVAAGVRW